MKATLLALAALLACVTAGPMRMMNERIDSCAVTCKPSKKFSYAPGQTFTYDYMVQTETSVDGASEEKASLIISGQANLEVIDQCEMILKLTNIEVRESSPAEAGGRVVVSPSSDRLSRVLEDTPLRFSFQDGVVDGLCPGSQEDPWALNVKRGVLSALQNSMDFEDNDKQSVKESDVTGHCVTEYEVNARSYWGGETSIRRHKDLQACSGRQGFMGSLHTARFDMDPSGMQSLPLMQSEHQCDQVVKEGIVQSSVCTEKHVFRPFSAQQGGALTTVLQTLKFRSQHSGRVSPKDWIENRVEMTFDHGYSIKDSSEARARAETLLVKLCQMTMEGVQPDVPRVFSQLVQAVKKLDSSDIKEVYRQLKEHTICSQNNQRTKKFFLDALPMAVSSEAVDLMKDLMVDGDVTGLQVDLYLAAMAFIPDPTPEMIESVQELLQKDDLKIRAMLAVSSMAHNQCQKTDCSSRTLDSILDMLAKDINYRCSVNDGNINKVLTALSAIGNIGHPKAINVLNRCLGNRVPLEVRVAAAQAYRRLPCDVTRRPLMEIVKDKGEDSEVRITSYQQLMTCPSKDLLDQIQVILQDEPDDSQVGSFIHSHLVNLQETSSPLKQDIRQMLQDVDTSKQFHSNPLKFSRNYEKSAFLSHLNLGAQAESNVIFSGQSPVPRSVSANLTVDVLGHSINLLEIGARLEGLEYLMESLQSRFFGDQKDNIPENKLDELKGSGYARVFGNELMYDRFQGLKSLTSGQSFNVLDFLIKLSKDHDYSFTQSLQFVEGTLTTPTAAGLPLTLSVNGSATVDVRAKGKMDLRKVSKSPRTLQVEGEIRPSGAVTIDGIMGVDALLTGSGLKMTSTLHSSLAIKGRVDLDRGKTLNVQLDMPDDRMDIIDMSTKFFIVHNKAESEQTMITDNRRQYETCTGSFLSSVTGLELCGQLQFPNASLQSDGPYFPLTGPSSVSVVLHKRDSHSGYKLLAQRVENKRSSIAQLSFDTPGSSVVRAVSFDMMIDYPQKEVDISFASPWKKTTVKGSLMSEDGLRSLSGSLVIDDDLTYALTSEVKVDQDSDSGLTVYTPLIQIRRPGSDDVTIRGDVKMDNRGKRFSSDLTLDGITRKPTQLQTSFTNTQSEKGVSAILTNGKKSYSAEAGINYNFRSGKNAQFRPLVVLSTPRGEAIRLEGQTDWRNGKMFKSDHTLTAPGLSDVPINLKCDIKQKARRKGPRYDLDLRLKSRPFTGKVQGFMVLADTSFTNLKIDYNGNRVGRDRVTISGKLSNRSTGVFKKYIISSTVGFRRHPSWNIDTSLDLEHKKKRSEGTLSIILGKDRKDLNNKITLSASMARSIKSMSEAGVDYKMKAIVPMMDMDYALTGSHKHSPNSLSSSMTFTYPKDQKVTAEVNLKGNLEKQMKVNGDISLTFPGHRYELDSDLRKKGKQLVHNLNMKTLQGPVLTIMSTYKPAKDSVHQVTSNIDISGFKPIKTSGMVGLEWNNLQLQAEAMSEQDTYSLSALSKLSKGPRGRWMLDASVPGKAVGLVLSGGLQKNTADLDLNVDWDKGSNSMDTKMMLSSSGSLQTTPDSISSSGKVELTWPLTDKLTAALSLDSDPKRYGVDAKVSKGPKSNSYVSTLNVLKPVTPGTVRATWSAGTPLRGWKKLEASLDHSAEPRLLTSSFKASRGKDNMQLTIAAKDNTDGDNKDVSASAGFSSNIRGLDDVSVALGHKDDGRKYTSSATIMQNKDKYSAEVDMSHDRNGFQIQNSGNLKLTTPARDVITTWQHKSSPDDLDSTFTCDWARGKRLQMTLTGNKKMTDQEAHVNTALTMQTPWKPVRDLNVIISHKMTDGHCTHHAEISRNGNRKASQDLNYSIGKRGLSGKFSMANPFMEDKAGSMDIQYKAYPLTIHGEMELGPGNTITADASFSKAGDRDMEGNMRLTTPFSDIRTVTIGGSVKSGRDDVTAKANLDYGMRKNYDVTITFRPETFALGRIVLHTPLDRFSSLETGYQISGDQNDFNAAADFTLKPIVDTYSASLGLKLDEEISGKLRINTPIKDLRYIQITANSKKADQGYRSQIEIEYFPRKTYSLTNFYTTEMPIIFSLNAETPIDGYDSFGLSLKHQHDDHSISTHGELQYLPDKVVESTFTLDWQRNIDGSLVVKTPFGDFEESKVSLRHDGDLDNFKSHAELEIMHETLTADAQFKYGYTTSGSLSLESSIEGVEKFEAEINKRGSSDNFRSSASIAYGDDKMEGTLTHKLNSRMLKTAVTFNSPFTKVVKSTVDMSNKQGTMQADISGQYGPKKVDTSSSLMIGDQDFSASSSVNYNLDGRSDQQMKIAVSKKGDLKNLDIVVSFSSPFTEDLKVSVAHSCDLPYSMRTTVSASAGEEYVFKTDNSFSNLSPSLSASTVNSYRMGGPLQEASISIDKKGELRDMSFTSVAKLGDKTISIEGGINTKKGIITNLKIISPIPSYERVGMTFSHEAQDNGFQQQGSLTYRTDKTIQYSVTFNHRDTDEVSLDASLQTPFEREEKNTIKFRHNYDKIRKECTGMMEIDNSHRGPFVVTYKRVGEMKQMRLEGSIEVDDEKINGHMEWLPLSHGYKHTMELTSTRRGSTEIILTSSTEVEKTDESISIKTMSSTPRTSFSFEADGSLNGFNLQLNGQFVATNSNDRKEMVQVSLKRLGSPDDLTFEMETDINSKKQITTGSFKNKDGEVSGNVNIRISSGHDFGGRFKHSGDLNRFNTEASLFFDEDEVKGKATFYRYQWKRLEATAEFSTPRNLLKAEYRHAGSDNSFTCSSSLQFDEDKKFSYDLSVTSTPNYDMTLTVKTPIEDYEKMVAEAKLQKMGNTRSASGSLDLGNNQRYAIEGSMDVDDDSLTMNGKVMTPLEQLPSVEIMGTYTGRINDFHSSMTFNSPQTDVMKYETIFKYVSPLDMHAAASVSSQLAHMEDLKAELKTADQGSAKNGFVLLRWTPEKEVMLDGSYMLKDSWYTEEMQADLTLKTPFEMVRSANLHVQHEQKEKSYMPKIELTLNEESIIDIEWELETGDNPSVSILTRSPRPTQVKASLTRDGHNVQTDIFINWDRDQNDQHVRLQTKAKDIRDDYQTNLDYSLKVIHPSHTLSTGVTVLSKEQKVTSEGFMTLDDKADKKIFYTLDFNDNSHYYGKAYDSTIKFGVPGRTLEAAGSYSKGRQTKTVDASFSWDADRDFNKQVGVNAKVTSGQKTITDLTLRLPSISKEVRINNELALNQGPVVWDSKTEVSYSSDVSRTLTFTSALKDISDSYKSGQNYSLSLSLSHPHTNTDISFLSHVGAVGDRLSAAMDTVYMTSRRTRNNMMLRGEIDRLRRQIDLQLDSPMKKMTLHGEVESMEPYVIKLTNTYDQQEPIQSQLKIDVDKKSMVFTSNYDLDNPEDQVVVRAGYLNSSAISAELHVQHQGQEDDPRSEGKVTVVLKTPTLIQAGLGWRPEAIEELKSFLQKKITANSDDIRRTATIIVDDIGQEVSDKYAAITEELKSELSPLIDLVEGELVIVGQQMDRVRRILSRMYKRNDLHMMDVGQYVLKVTEILKEYSASYKTAYDGVLHKMRAGLQDMGDYDIRQHYKDFMDSLSMKIKMSIANSVEGIEEVVEILEDLKREMMTSGQEQWDHMMNRPMVRLLHIRVQRLGQDYQWLQKHLSNSVSRVNLPEGYSSAMYQAHSQMMDGLTKVMDSQHVRKVKDVASEAYQQGAWALQYWKIEDKVRQVPRKMVALLLELLAQEFQDLKDRMQFLTLSKVTVYDPVLGQIKVDIVLPFPMKSLEEMPDWSRYIPDAQAIVDNYLPDKKSVVNMYQQIVPWSNNDTTPEDDDIIPQFEAYTPVRQVRRRYSPRRAQVQGM